MYVELARKCSLFSGRRFVYNLLWSGNNLVMLIVIATVLSAEETVSHKWESVWQICFGNGLRSEIFKNEKVCLPWCSKKKTGTKCDGFLLGFLKDVPCTDEAEPVLKQ